MKIYSSSSNRFFGAIRGRAWTTVILTIVITALTFHALPQTSTSQYCPQGNSSTSATEGATNNPCSSAHVTKYGFPVKGSIVSINPANSSAITNLDGITFVFNFLCIFGGIYVLVRLCGIILS
jgi:hypothetical protein